MALVSGTGTIIEEIARRSNEVSADIEDDARTSINLALRNIYNTSWDSPTLQTSADRTLSSGTRLYTNLPTDFEKMNAITDPAGDLKLKYLEPEQFDLLQPSATEGGRPEVYTIRGNAPNARIEYYPQPGAAYTLHLDYQKSIDTVSAYSSTPELPVRYYELLVLYGESVRLRRRGLREEARAVMQEFEQMKADYMTDLRKRTTETERIRSVREFTYALNGSTQDNPRLANFFNS